jgi:hypothetical protein
VNDNYKELKARLRKLDEILEARGKGNMPFAQAVSAVRRKAKVGDRTREPNPVLRGLLEKAESMARSLVG